MRYRIEEGVWGLTTTPPSKMHPTMVVPVLVALGRGMPRACRAALRLKFEKSNPGIVEFEACEGLGACLASGTG